MEHAPRLEQPFPWRIVAFAAVAIALAELLALLAMTGVRLAPKHSAPAQTVVRVQTVEHTTTAPAPPAATRPTPQPLRPRARVSVLVLNGNGITHAAAAEAATLVSRGYRAATPADAPNHDYAHSIVLFAPGYSREGKRLGRDAGIRIVGPLDGMTPSQLRGSKLVVILGDS